MALTQTTDLGVINRLRGSITLPSFAALNITASVINEDGIQVQYQDPGGNLIRQMTGAVVSLMPFSLCTVTFNVVRTQSVATAWFNQYIQNAAIGDLYITPVTSVAPEHFIRNAVITNIGRIAENGQSADVPITVTGSIIINKALWGST